MRIMVDIFAVEMMKKFSNFREIVYIFSQSGEIWDYESLPKRPLLTQIMQLFQAQNLEFMSGTSKLSGYGIIILSISPSPTKGGARSLH